MLGAEHPSLATNWNELGTLAQESGDPAEAVRCFQRAFDIASQTLAPSSPTAMGYLLNSAESLVDEGAVDEAERAAERVSSAVATNEQAALARMAQLHRVRAKIALARGQGAAAVVVARQGLQRLVASLGAQHPDTALLRVEYAMALAGAGQCAEAVVEFEQYLEVARALSIDRSPDAVRAMVRGADCLTALGRSPEAVVRGERAMTTLEHLEGNERLRAEAELTLARARWRADPKDPRVVSLAEQARARWQQAGRQVEVAKVDAFLGGLKR